MALWWAKDLDPRGLSQGDVVADVPFGTFPVPPVALSKSTIKGGVTAWLESGPPGGPYLVQGGRFPAIVLSHDCELDKPQRKPRVLAAPLRPMSELESSVSAEVLAQRRLSLMPVPAIPTLGHYYADLRLIQNFDRAILDSARVASMSQEGLGRLRAQVVAFLFRLDLAENLP